MGKELIVVGAGDVDRTPIYNEEEDLVYIPFVGAIASLAEPAKRPTTPVETNNFNNGEWMPLPEGDDWHQVIKTRVGKLPLLIATLNYETMYLASAGLFYGKKTGYDPKTKQPIYEQVDDDRVEGFFEKNNKNLFLEDFYRNLVWWNNVFSDFGQNPGKTEIACLSVQDTMDCRFSAQNKKTGHHDYVIISADFATGGGQKENRQKVRCVDPYFDWNGQMKELPDKRFIYPSFFTTPGRKYMQQAAWHSIFETKWPDLAEKIPASKLNMMLNSMHIKYVLHIPEYYWKFVEPKWDSKNAAERKLIRKTTVDEWEKSLTGVEKTGKTIAFTYKTEDYASKFSRFEVQELKGNFGNGDSLEDSQEANQQMLFALAFDGSLIGKVPGKEAGSGSDKRLADEIFWKSRKAKMLKACEVLEVMCSYNGWRYPDGKKISWFPPEQILTTLNNVSPANRPNGG